MGGPMSAQDSHPDPNNDTKIDLAPAGDAAPDHSTPPANKPHAKPDPSLDDVAMYDVIEPPKTDPAPSVQPGKPHIQAPGLIDDFDEDADFSEETVLRESRQKKAALEDTVADEPADDGWEAFRPRKDAPHFVQPKGRITIPGVKAPAIAAAVLLLIAIVLAFTRVQHGSIYAALSVLYLGIMHSITGVGAVVVGTLDAKARFGSFAAAWARMFIAVSILLVVINLPLQGNARFLLAPIGAAVYALALYLLFRWNWRSVGIVAASHFALAMLLYIGEWLHAMVMRAGTSATPG